jgi:hypothetical protein
MIGGCMVLALPPRFTPPLNRGGFLYPSFWPNSSATLK